MSKLIIKDVSTGQSYEYGGSAAEYTAAQSKLDQLRASGHQVDLSANDTGRRLQDMEDSQHTGIFGRLFS